MNVLYQMWVVGLSHDKICPCDFRVNHNSGTSDMPSYSMSIMFFSKFSVRFILFWNYIYKGYDWGIFLFSKWSHILLNLQCTNDIWYYNNANVHQKLKSKVTRFSHHDCLHTTIQPSCSCNLIVWWLRWSPGAHEVLGSTYCIPGQGTQNF